MAEYNLNEEVFEEINLADFKSDVNVFEGMEFPVRNSEIFYLDENNNYVDESEAVKSVIRVTDENGNLVEEIWGFNKEDEEENSELKVLYVDDNDNEVEEELATHMIMKKFVDGKEVSSEKYPIYKDAGMSL